MNIVFIASESNPYCKSGGLADVVFSLAKQFKDAGHQCTVILPYYNAIHLQHTGETLPRGRIDIHMSWRHRQAEIWESSACGVHFLFVGDEGYFGRDNLYGYPDDGERFAFFAMAAKSLMESLNEKIDIVYCHDWQSAVLPLLIHQGDKRSKLRRARTVLTIHNPAFLGLMHPDALGELFNIYDGNILSSILIDSEISTLLAGIRYADLVTTVSPTHAKELKIGNAYRIGDALLSRGSAFVGVINGVDEDEFNPNLDPFIIERFNLKNVTKAKKACKTDLFHSYRFDPHHGPLFVLVSRLYEQKGIPLILEVASHIMDRGGNILVLGNGEFSYCSAFAELSSLYPGRIGIYLGYSRSLAHKLYAGGDFFLMPSLFEPCGISQMIAQRYACLPIARDTGGLHDTIDDLKDGILFRDYDIGGLLYGIDKAFEIYEDRPRFAAMRKAAYRRDHSWKRSADAYLKLFRSILRKPHAKA